MSIQKPLEAIDESDLLAVVNDQIPEGKTIEYKLLIPSASDQIKRNFSQMFHRLQMLRAGI